MKNEIKEVEENDKVSEIDVDTIQEELVEVDSIEEPTSEEVVVEEVEALFETEKTCNTQDNKYQEILDKVKEFVVPRKKLLIGASTIAIVCVVGFSIVSPSVNSVFKGAKSIFSDTTRDVEDVIEYVSDRYSNDLVIFKTLNANKRDKVLNKLLDYLNTQIYSATGMSAEEYNVKNNVKIVELDNEYTGSGYGDLHITIQNNSNRNIRYVKLNIYFKDESGNIIKSDWTNDRSIILPGAKQTISKMVKYDGWKYFSAEVDEVSF